MKLWEGGGGLCMGIGSTVECSFVALAQCFSSLAHPYITCSWVLIEPQVWVLMKLL